jgi:hypothetical protein
VDNIKMDLIEIGWDGMDWIDLAQDRDQWKALVNAVPAYLRRKLGTEILGTIVLVRGGYLSLKSRCS